LQFRYVTDWAYTEKGWFLDEISVVADGDEIFHDGMEAGTGDWQVDPADGWMITTGTIIGAQYYLVEWRNASGFDAGLQAYQTVYYDADEWEVDRAPHSLPGMLLWHRNSLYSFDYTLGDAWYDAPSIGPKHALLVVDSHSFPYTWDSVQTITGQDLQVSGSIMPVDAAFTLQDTTAFTLRLGYDFPSYRFLDEPIETKTFGPRPGIKQFHDSLGYYPGLWCCFHNDIYFWDNDASAVVPAASDYTTRITWADNAPATQLYGEEAAGSILGTGNPGDTGVQFGVHLAVQAQADTGAWGRIMVWNAPALLDLEKTASRETVIPGGYLRYTLSVTNLSPIWQHFVVDDPLPEYTNYVLGGHYDEETNSIHWEGQVAPGEMVDIGVLVTLDADVPIGTLITNQAVLTDDALGDSDSISTEVVAP
jgi:immune inhibitor A